MPARRGDRGRRDGPGRPRRALRGRRRTRRHDGTPGLGRRGSGGGGVAGRVGPGQVRGGAAGAGWDFAEVGAAYPYVGDSVAAALRRAPLCVPKSAEGSRDCPSETASCGQGPGHDDSHSSGSTGRWARASLCLYARSLYPHSEHHLPAHFSARASPPVLSPPPPPPRALAPLTARLRRSVVLCRRWRSCGRRTCCCSSCYPGTRDASSRAPLLSSSLPPLPLAATLLLISFLDSFWRGGSGVDQMFAQSCTRFSF